MEMKPDLRAKILEVLATGPVKVGDLYYECRRWHALDIFNHLQWLRDHEQIVRQGIQYSLPNNAA